MTEPVRIPADVDRPDRLLGNLTARQLLILAGAGAASYLVWAAVRTLVPPLVFLAAAAPVLAATAALALGSRDGISLDRLAVAAIRHRLAPARQVPASEGIRPAPGWLAATATGPGPGRPPAPLELPARAVAESDSGTGARALSVVDLGGDGMALLAVCSTVNFALRTPTEQQSLVGVFGRWLHSLTGPAQILIRAETLDLSGQIRELRERAPSLPHPALEAAAIEHADYLAQLAATTDLLRRQVVLVLRDPAPGGGRPDPRPPRGAAAVTRRWRGNTRAAHGRTDAARWAAEARLARRLTEAAELLAPAGITVTPLDPAQTTAVLAAACNPDTLLPASTDLAAADDIITTAGRDDSDAYGSGDDGDYDGSYDGGYDGGYEGDNDGRVDDGADGRGGLADLFGAHGVRRLNPADHHPGDAGYVGGELGGDAGDGEDADDWRERWSA